MVNRSYRCPPLDRPYICHAYVSASSTFIAYGRVLSICQERHAYASTRPYSPSPKGTAGLAHLSSLHKRDRPDAQHAYTYIIIVPDTELLYLSSESSIKLAVYNDSSPMIRTLVPNTTYFELGVYQFGVSADRRFVFLAYDYYKVDR